jgi:photosystem II stability/assembly factor-like uncharacterized protein
MTLIFLLTAAAVPPRLESQTSGTTARLQAISVVSPMVVWVSGARGTYARTSDGGATWHSGVVPGADSLEFRDVHAFSARSAVLLSIGTGPQSRIYRTVDAGATWTMVWQNPDPKAFYDCIDFRGAIGVAIADAVGATFPLLRTIDGGRTWKPYAPPGYDSVQAEPEEGAFAASGTCVVLKADGSVVFGTAGGARVIRVGAGGSAAVPTPVVHGKMAGIATIAFEGAEAGIAAGGNLSTADSVSPNVVVTRDGGRTWTLGGHPAFPGAVYGLAYVPGRRGTVVAVGPKGSAWSADGGATWTALDQRDHWSVGFGSGSVGWMVGPGGRITKITFE